MNLNYKFNLYLLLATYLLAVLASCSNDDDGGAGGDPVAVRFAAGGIVRTRTTAEGNQWAADDKIGIFMLRTGASLNSYMISEGASNRQYKAQTGNTDVSGFTPDDATQTIYYPQNGSRVDFIAYYPYKATVEVMNGYAYPVDVTNQSAPADIDVLYSNNAINRAKDDAGAVDLQFDHVLSKLSFTLIQGTGAPDLTGATITISRLSLTADMDLGHGILSNLGQPNGTITANSNNSAIVIPQTLSGTKLTVTLSDNRSAFEWNFTTSEFQPGKNHQYNVTISKTGITVTTGDITDWGGAGAAATDGGAGLWKVGDYYPYPDVDLGNPDEKAKIQGVVFWVDPADSRHGKIVWLKEMLAAQNHSQSTTWATNQEFGGWALPDLIRTYTLSTAYATYGKQQFNTKLTDAGGNGITDQYYWTSESYGSPYYLGFSYDRGSDSSFTMDTQLNARCIKSF